MTVLSVLHGWLVKDIPRSFDITIAEAAKRRLEEMRKASPEAASSGMTPDPKAFKKAPAEKKEPTPKAKAKAKARPSDSSQPSPAKPTSLQRKLSAAVAEAQPEP